MGAMRRATARDLMAALHEVGGRDRPGALGLFSVMRDEMWFLPAFLDHYRRIGVERFVILDDGSSDGTREHLLDQPDCLVLGSDYRYGDPAVVRHYPLQRKRTRAGPLYKELIPQRYFAGGYGLYADADEFLFLPPGAASLGDVIGTLDHEGAACVAASLVEFFPETTSGLDDARPPAGLDDLLARYPCYEARPVVRPRRFRQPARAGASKSEELFARHLPADGRTRRSPVLKTPIVRHDARTRRRGSHKANRPPVPHRLMTMAHFVYTGAMRAKVARALDWQAHSGGGAKYRAYAALLRAMDASGADFTGPDTVRFDGVDGLVESGLMAWPR